jgi:predicted DCC family thiol-disulfide oxidoreductase YuxK
MGMILIDGNTPERRWQGSDAAEEIGRILPGGEVFVAAYRAMPGMKWMGDRVYEQVRDNRYTLFGKRRRLTNLLILLAVGRSTIVALRNKIKSGLNIPFFL